MLYYLHGTDGGVRRISDDAPYALEPGEVVRLDGKDWRVIKRTAHYPVGGRRWCDVFVQDDSRIIRPGS